jgi:hypothetical protein
MASFPYWDVGNFGLTQQFYRNCNLFTNQLVSSLQFQISVFLHFFFSAKMNLEKLEDAIDLSHHLSALARNRTQSPLKRLHKYLQKPGVIGLAGGSFVIRGSPAQFADLAIRNAKF